MAIVRSRQPPATGPRLVGKALRDLGGHPDRAAALGMAGGAAINLSQPLPVFRLGLDDIVDEHCLDKAVEVGWRYLIESAAGGGAGYADVRQVQSGDFKFASLSKNANADRLLEAAHLAQQVGAGSSVEYEARILDVPAVYVSAIWLAAATPVFIPYIDPAHLGQPGATVRVQSDFLKNLVQAAADAKRHLNNGPGHSGAAP
jgi:hypothetical protein